jgi:class 3 adenylate cyclase
MRTSIVILAFLIGCASLCADSTLLQQAESQMKESVGKGIELAQQALAQAETPLETARAELVLSRGYHFAGAEDRALSYCQQALRGFEKLKDNAGQADALEEMGYIYWKLKDGSRVKDCFAQSLILREKTRDPKAIADALNNIGIFTLHYLNDSTKARALYQRALELSRGNRYPQGEANSLNNLGNACLMAQDIPGSLEYNRASLACYRKLNDQRRVAVNLLIVGYLHQLQERPDSARTYYREAIALSRKIGTPSVERDTYLNLSALYEEQGDHLRHLEYYKLYADLKDSLANDETARNLANLQTRFSVEKQELQNRLLQASIIRQRQWLLSILSLLLILLGGTLLILREKRRSEHLLRNILPRDVATELKRRGFSPPRTYHGVTVLFSDLADFTRASSTLPPETMIAELNDLFTAFDNFVEANGCERIKTIGDAYFAVCGLPTAFPDHTIRLVRTALAMVDFLQTRNREAVHPWRIRIGLHTGPVVGGIVGVKKYIYDVFGDTVNTASRMESLSEPMRVNVSEAVYEVVHDEFECEERPSIEVKGKGEMRMWFVNAEKAGSG